MKRWMLVSAVGAPCVVIGGAVSVGALAADASEKKDEGAGAAAVPFAEELVKAVSGYEGWKCANRLKQARIGPMDCFVPPPAPAVRASDALDSSPHGRKLYYLYVRIDYMMEQIAFRAPHEEARKISTYAEGLDPSNPQPLGQVLVKQSWTANEIDYELVQWRGEPKHAFDHSAKTAFEAGEQRELFVMMKLDPATPGTDNGWVYGVLSPDGKQVLHAGRIESCMECHVNAPHDRLFGLK